jgi:hypothetical protein
MFDNKCFSDCHITIDNIQAEAMPYVIEATQE